MSSPYATGGGGVHFETRVVAYYLAAALAESPARAVPGIYVTQVLTQRAAFGEPLDDVVVSARLEDGRTTKLSLQIKSSLTFTEKDTEWVAVLGQAWSTFASDDFEPTLHRLGVAISSYSARVDKYYQSVLTWAAHSPSGKNFIERISKEDFSHKDQREFVARTRTILGDHAGRTIDDDTIWRFLRIFHILHFDFDAGDGSRDQEGAIDRLRYVLQPDERDKAGNIWSHLIVIAGETTPVGGGESRSSLISSLASLGLPQGSSNLLWSDLLILNQESLRGMASIKDDIHGLRLNRIAQYEAIQDALSSARFVQIDGEPGSGKSALLRQVAEEAAQAGPIFFLKDSRVQPRGWSAHAGQLGISNDLVHLMRELSVVGNATLFIDGIDKINDVIVQVTINDLIQAVAFEPSLSAWKVLVTVREQNLDHITTWLSPDALRQLSVRSTTLPALSKKELGVIADVFPRLRSLLLETGSADVILRRPFFLEAVLNLAGRQGTTALPASEVELLNLWWSLGGADQSSGAAAQYRRNALLTLAERFIAAPTKPISIRDILPEPLEELKSAGVIRDQLANHSVGFSHDIYEEWALCEWLLSQLPITASVLRTVGEPQELIRPLQLLGSHELETHATDAEWKRLYEDMAEPTLRPVWQRAVLSACLRSTRTTEILDKLTDYLHHNNDDGLKKLLNALRTLEVIPNANFLDELLLPDLQPDERVRLAHAAAWPKGFTWVRFLDWFLEDEKELAPSLIPDLVPFFTTWQQAYSGKNVRHCRQIGEIAYGWLIEFEKALHPNRWEDIRKPFGLDLDYSSDRDLEDLIRTLFFSSASDVRDLVGRYLKAKASDKFCHIYREKIIKSSATLARAVPNALIDYILTACLSHPKDSERSGRSRLDSHQLGLEGYHTFYPASPYQGPFLVLLREHEEEGLRLIKAICNHSIDVWRWTHEQSTHEHDGVKPLPVEVEFSWGVQTFWGDQKVYLWFRGYWGNDACRSALMALELWAFERIEAGEDFSAIFGKIVKGNQCVAALGLAASLCIAHLGKSLEQALPLITCPHVWSWDLARCVQDNSGMPPNEIGNWGRDQPLLQGVRDLNRRPHRASFIRDIVPYFVFSQNIVLKERYTEGIRSMPVRLPLEFSEDQADEDYVATLRKRMEWYVEQADPQYWHAEPTGDGKQIKIWNDPPSAKTAEHQQQLAEQEKFNHYLRLALWAQKCLDEDKLQDNVQLTQAISEAQDFDCVSLFDGDAETFSASHHRASVAGVAYAAVRFSDADIWTEDTAHWALNVLKRASKFKSAEDRFSRRSILSMHPLIFATHGYAAALARGFEPSECQSALFHLAIHPLEAVAEAVVKSSVMYAEERLEFYWELFNLLLRQCLLDKTLLPDYHSPDWERAEFARNLSLIAEAESKLAEEICSSLPDVPMPWLRRDEHDLRPNEYQRNPVRFRWDLADRTILKIDFKPLLLNRNDLRSQIFSLIEQLVAMTFQEVTPPFAKSRRDRRGDVPYEWVFAFFHWLGSVASHFTQQEVEELILRPIFEADNEAALLAMQNFAPAFLGHTILSPGTMTEGAFTTWEKIAEWVLENPEGRTSGHVDREYSLCVFILLFCFGGDLRPLNCVLEEGWEPLNRFLPIIERAVAKFGTNTLLYLGVLRFFKRGGLDLMPDPGLGWFRRIAGTVKDDHNFWSSNGDETVEVLRLVLTRKKQQLTPAHQEAISFMTDIMVDNGVRGAGFLQQDLMRA